MTSSGADNPERPSKGETLVGRVLSERYRIESVLGEGGMGAVYLAEHVLMRKRLAVKVLHPEMTRMPEIVARFEREAMAAAHIEHPNVAAATDFGKLEDGAFFLVLEYIEGTSLRDLIAEGPIAYERALHIVYQMASALARAHALGIVHRDLKPENVMLVDRDGDRDFVKVLDFGIAKVPVGELSRRDPSEGSGEVLTQLGMVYGTPEYMAPEQALGQEVDARADLYALGVILFEMLAGVRPFEAPSKVALLGMKVTTDPPSIAEKNGDVRVPDSVEALVKLLLDKEAAHRFQDARDVLSAIEKGRIGEAKTEPPMAMGNPSPLGGPASARYRASLQSVPRGVAREGEARPLTPRWVEARARAEAWAVSLRERLPARLSQASLPTLLASAALSVVVLVLVSVAALRGAGPAAPPGSGSAASTSVPLVKRLRPPPIAPSDVLAAAANNGSSALEELSLRYPEDPAVWRELVQAYTEDKRGAEAMRALVKLLALSERAADDDDVKDAISAAAAGPAESADAAFDLMENGLGARGADLLFQLSTSKGLAARTLNRAKQSLAKPEVKARMSPPLSIFLDLRSASGCEAKKALLGRAKDYGDARVLPALRSLSAPKGCGFLGLADCWSCMRRDNALGAALAAVEERGSAGSAGGSGGKN